MTFQQAIEHAKQMVKERFTGKTEGRLAERVAIVTGAAQGFGLGIAKALYREGVYLVIADLNETLASEVAKDLGDRAISVAVDISDETAVQNMLIKTVEAFGGVDLLVANAGVLIAGGLAEMTMKHFEFVTKINYTGYFNCVKYTAQIMKAQHAGDANWVGDIVQINSKSGLVGSKKNFAYAGGKFGGIGLTQSFALELIEDNIKVNTICPGNYYDGPLWSDPERGLFKQYLDAGKVPGATSIEEVKAFYLAKTPIKRGCFPEDVAKAIFYCVEQQYETGQAIPVTGGQVMLN